MAKANITMVAFHGCDKPAALQRLLDGLMGEIGKVMRSDDRGTFEEYTRYQIHATMIGMEVDLFAGNPYGHWFWENKRERRKIDVCRLWEQALQETSERNPFLTIRFGGFRKAYCQCDTAARGDWKCVSSESEFHSCDRSAYEGSFYAYAPGPAILTGWPVKGPNDLDEFSRLLYNFRKSAESAGFMDKYHEGKNSHWKDDDCFIRIGTFLKQLQKEPLDAIQESIREYLSGIKPVTVDIKREDIWIILYNDPSLRDANIMEKVALNDFLSNPETVQRLYETLEQPRKNRSRYDNELRGCVKTNLLNR